MITGMFCFTSHLKLSGVNLLCSWILGLMFRKGILDGDALFWLHSALGLGGEDLGSPVAWCWNNQDAHSLMSSLA